MFSFGGALGTSTSSLGSSVSTSASVSTSSSTATAPSNCLYAELNSRNLLELNCLNLHLSLISPPSSTHSSSSSSLYASTTATKHLCTIEGIQGRPVALAVNSIGSSVAVVFDDLKSVAILNNLQSPSLVIEMVRIHLTSAWLWMDWHSLSPGDTHLTVLTKGNQLFLFNTLTVLEDDTVEPELHLKLPANRLDPLVRCSFVKNVVKVKAAVDWSLLGLFCVSESGDVRFLAPFLPRQFKVKRSQWIEGLLEDDSIDGTARRWLNSCLNNAKFLSTPEGDTDWILVDSYVALSAFDSLQPALQGPFLIQPEPLEIHHLSSFDRVCDFVVLEDAECMTIAFSSGKIDLLAFGGAGLGPAWQLTGQSNNKTERESNQPILVLLESIDLGHSTGASKRSITHSVKFIYSSINKLLISPGNDQVVSVNFSCSDEAIECSASVVVSALKSPAQAFLMGKVFPGAISVENGEVNKIADSHILESSLAPDLQKITNFAFPLGKMEIEEAALQLEGLLESTIKALNRLKEHQLKHLKFDSKAKLPEEASEEDCAKLNDQLSKWQQEVVMPAMRVGHELALRAQELVQILRTQRQVLTRAHTLLTSKPDRLEIILRNLSVATQKNTQLQQRLCALKEKMPAMEGGLGDAVLSDALQQLNSRLGSCMNSPSVKSSDLVNIQLTLQTEILQKLQKLLQ